MVSLPLLWQRSRRMGRSTTAERPIPIALQAPLALCGGGPQSDDMARAGRSSAQTSARTTMSSVAAPSRPQVVVASTFSVAKGRQSVR